METKTKKPVPALEDLKAELKREQNKYRCAGVLKSAVYALVVVTAIAVLAATLWMPVFQIYGSSMLPTLEEGQIVVCLKDADFEQGDLVAFYVGNVNKANLTHASLGHNSSGNTNILTVKGRYFCNNGFCFFAASFGNLSFFFSASCSNLSGGVSSFEFGYFKRISSIFLKFFEFVSANLEKLIQILFCFDDSVFHGRCSFLI